MPARKKKTTTKRKTTTVKRTTAKKTVAARKTKLTAIRDKQTKTQIVRQIAEETELTSKQVQAVFAVAAELAERHLIKRGSGEFKVPELGVKITRKVKPATKKRLGRNPATGEEIMIAAKPKREVIKVTALKSLKEVLA